MPSTDLTDIATFDDDDVRVVVETPAGSRAKIAFDRELGAMVLKKRLPLGLSYPFDWGFVPGTLGEDGDPLDALVLAPEGSFPGVVYACRPVAAIALTEKAKGTGKRERNDRLILAPVDDLRFDRKHPHKSLDRQAMREIERFFLDAVLFSGRDARVTGWGDSEDAKKLIKLGVKRRKKGAGA